MNWLAVGGISVRDVKAGEVVREATHTAFFSFSAIFQNSYTEPYNQVCPSRNLFA